MDIKKLTLEELSGIVNIYPWFALARKELCRSMQAMGGLSEGELSSAAFYLADRRLMLPLMSRRASVDCSDSGISALMRLCVETPSRQQARPRVAGADYFSTEDYARVSRSEDRSILASLGRTEEYKESRSDAPMPEVCTETLARIYLEQGYPEEAREIYSKLILAYPEKSAYFAALIEKLF